MGVSDVAIPAAAPTISSAYKPHPGRGESPTRPGSLKGGPDVDTPAATPPDKSIHSIAAMIIEHTNSCK